MVVDMGYWSKVIKRIIIFAFTILFTYLAFKLAVFYMPFLVAFIISLMLEPMIKFLMRHTKLHRRTSSIIVLIFISGIIIGLVVWGITALISESSNLLQDLNYYFEKAYTQIQDFISSIDFSKFKVSDKVLEVFQNSVTDVLGAISGWVKNLLTSLINGITSIPTIAIYIGISLIALYFICTDKIYMLDQLEHHLPKTWVKRIGVHIRDLIKTLGGYLKAEATLVLISFIISLIGLYIFKFVGLNIEFPLLAALGIGFVDALPIFGSATVMIPWAIIAGIDGDLTLGIAILGLLTIMSIVRQFLEPRIVGNNIGIHPIFTLIAMYTGFKFIGVIGMLIGPIILIILKNIFATMIEQGVAKAIFDRK
ncbi:MAG: sporulation integral membrane protein YtvI [Clostridia bacterium]